MNFQFFVTLESPYSPKNGRTVEENKRYLQKCIRDCLHRGEVPFASHQMYTEALNDSAPEDRELGISAGFFAIKRTDYTVVYCDWGISFGMLGGIEEAVKNGKPIFTRSLYGGIAPLERFLERKIQRTLNLLPPSYRDVTKNFQATLILDDDSNERESVVIQREAK